MLRMLIGILLVVAVLATASRAQTIGARVGSGAEQLFAPSTNITIDVGTLAANTTTLLRVYDTGASTTSAPSLSVGTITIRGAAPPSAKLKILVAAQSEAEFSDEGSGRSNPRRRLLAGVVGLGDGTTGGIVFTGPVGNATDTSLRDASVLAISAMGDLHGNIDVGRVFRIETGQIATTPTGTIYSNITTHSPFSGTDFRDDAIVFITAGRGILGNIAATGGRWIPDENGVPQYHQASIGQIVVGPLDSPVGIQGHITAVDGHIGNVYTTGPIGSPEIGTTAERRVNIYALTGIREIRAIQEGEAFLEVDYPKRSKNLDFHVNVDAAYGWPRGAEAPVTGSPADDAPLRLLQTDGSVLGTIHAGCIVPTARFQRDANGEVVVRPDGTTAVVNENFHSGILVKGVMDAPISVDYVVGKCDIMARTFTSPITVGVMFQGVLIAHGRDDRDVPPAQAFGYMPSVDIGNHPFSDYATWTPSTVPPYGLFTRGMSGIGDTPAGPIMGVLPETFAEVGFDSDRWHLGYTSEFWLYGFCGACGNVVQKGTADALIRASRIDVLNIKQMRTFDLGGSVSKKVPPRIEVEVIGSLTIGDLRDGVIWSGTHEWDDDRGQLDPANAARPFLSGNPDVVSSFARRCEYIPENDFTTIAYATVGCIGHYGHVWYQACPRFTVLRSCLGGLHVPRLDTNQTIWIGDRLGSTLPDVPEMCECSQNDPPVASANPPPVGTRYFVSCQEQCVNPCTPTPAVDDLVPVHPRTPQFMSASGISVGDHLGSATGERVLRGQIIINGNNRPLSRVDQDGLILPDLRWEGRVTTGPTLPRIAASSPCNGNEDLTPIPTIGVKPNDSVPPLSANWDLTAPYYRLTPKDLGNIDPNSRPVDGGSIGLAPYHLHESACIPPHNSICKMDGIPETWFEATAAYPVIIQNYGPITKVPSGASWTSCVKIEAQPLRHCPTDTQFPGPAELCGWIDVTSAFRVRGPGESGWTLPNAIGLSRAPGKYPKPGIYRVSLVRPGSGIAKIRSADVLGLPPVVWPPSCVPAISSGDDPDLVDASALANAYVFKIAPDCDHDLVNDEVTNPNAELCQLMIGCRVDVSGDNVISVQDIFDFLNAWFAGCTPSTGCTGINADWNQNGILDVQDIFDYLSAWFSTNASGCV